MAYYHFNARYHHIKLHGRCLFRINKELWKRKLSIQNYLRKGWFYISGIIRALLPAWNPLLETPNYPVPLYNLYNQPSGSLTVSSSLTLTPV